MPRKTNSHKFAPAPTVAPTVAPTASPTYEKPSIGSTILQGFALGTGQSLAFNIFRSEPIKEEKQEKQERNPKDFIQCIQDKDCNKLLESFTNKEFIQCMKDNNYEDCKQYLNF